MASRPVLHTIFTAWTPAGNGVRAVAADAPAVMEAAREADTVRSGLIEIRPDRFEAVADGHRLALTSRELRLLDALSSRPDRVVSRQELSAVAWERPLRPDDRSVDVYISRVRAKLEVAAPGWRFIHTHFGFGYRFAPERVRPGPGVRPNRLHPFHKPATRR